MIRPFAFVAFAMWSLFLGIGARAAAPPDIDDILLTIKVRQILHQDQELRPYNIHVGVVYPPDTQTPQLDYENQTKPLETRLVGGTPKPISADQMARAIVQGIAKRRFAITANWQSAALVRFSGVLAPLLNRMFDRSVRRARRQRGAGR